MFVALYYPFFFFYNISNLCIENETEKKRVCICECVQVVAQPALWFWTGRVTGYTPPTWETPASWWSGEGRWSTAPTSSSTTSTHPSSCPLLPRGLRGPSSVTGETPSRQCAFRLLQSDLSWSVREPHVHVLIKVVYCQLIS